LKASLKGTALAVPQQQLLEQQRLTAERTIRGLLS